LNLLDQAMQGMGAQRRPGVPCVVQRMHTAYPERREEIDALLAACDAGRVYKTVAAKILTTELGMSVSDQAIGRHLRQTCLCRLS
jgi:hypothetical protein